MEMIARLITIVNDVILERTEANRVAAASSTAPASKRGQCPRSERAHLDGQGVQHKRCNAYDLRREARTFDKRIREQRKLRWSP